MRIDIVTAFPNLIRGAFDESMIRRAQEKHLVSVRFWDPRDETTDRHRTIDDYGYGGGAGMILKPEPFFRTVERIRKQTPGSRPRVLIMTPQGERFDQAKASRLARETHLIFLCGHYRGFDERIVQELATDEISIGDFILTGGELAAAVIADSVIRLLPGVLGNADSGDGDSFTCGLLDYPHYTRPEEFRGMRVPDVLLSGDHARIRNWRIKQAEERTRNRRADLWEEYSRSNPENQ